MLLTVKPNSFKNAYDTAFVIKATKADLPLKAFAFISYNFMYNLMNKYLVTIPASTYGGVKSTVSLFDHHKLTSAISSCLYDKECFEKKEFCMLMILII